MNRDALLSVALALCCVFAIGTSATSLDSAVSTKPSEVVDVDYASLPIDSQDAEQLRRQIEGAGSGQIGGAASSSAADSAAASSAGEDGQQNVQKRAGEPQGQRKAERPKESGESQQVKQKQKRQRKQGQGSGPKPPEKSLLDRLLDLLTALFDLLVRTLPLLALAAVLIRYRRRIISRVDALFGQQRAETDGGRPPLGDPNPSNEVASAWYEMVVGIGLDRDPTRTPRECARRAIDAGLDREAVGSLTEAFETVRYGEEPPTSELTTRARKSIRRLREQGFGGDRA